MSSTIVGSSIFHLSIMLWAWIHTPRRRALAIAEFVVLPIIRIFVEIIDLIVVWVFGVLTAPTSIFGIFILARVVINPQATIFTVFPWALFRSIALEPVSRRHVKHGVVRPNLLAFTSAATTGWWVHTLSCGFQLIKRHVVAATGQSNQINEGGINGERLQASALRGGDARAHTQCARCTQRITT